MLLDRYKDEKLLKFLEECSFLDPRFKNLSWLTSEHKEVVQERIVQHVMQLHKSEEQEPDGNQSDDVLEVATNNEITCNPS